MALYRLYTAFPGFSRRKFHIVLPDMAPEWYCGRSRRNTPC